MSSVTISRSERRHTRILARDQGVPALRWSHPTGPVATACDEHKQEKREHSCGAPRTGAFPATDYCPV
jgi:hypothetical protein